MLLAMFIFFNLFYLFYFWLLGFSLLLWAFSSSGEWARCGVRASHCGGFSCYGAWALGTWASVVVACGLSSYGSWALEHRLSSCGTWA